MIPKCRLDTIWNRLKCFLFGHIPNDFDCTKKQGVITVCAEKDIIIKVDMCGRCGCLYTNFEHGKMNENDPNAKITTIYITK